MQHEVKFGRVCQSLSVGQKSCQVGGEGCRVTIVPGRRLCGLLAVQCTPYDLQKTAVLYSVHLTLYSKQLCTTLECRGGPSRPSRQIETCAKGDRWPVPTGLTPQLYSVNCVHWKLYNVQNLAHFIMYKIVVPELLQYLSTVPELCYIAAYTVPVLVH